MSVGCALWIGEIQLDRSTVHSMEECITTLRDIIGSHVTTQQLRRLLETCEPKGDVSAAVALHFEQGQQHMGERHLGFSRSKVL